MSTLSPIEESALSWQVHLRKRQPSRLPILLLGIGFGGLGTWGIFHQPLPTLAVIALLTGAVSEYLLPITYRLDDVGVIGRYGWNRFVLRWSEIKRVVPLRGGVLLTPLSVASRLDSFRGVYIRFALREEAGNRTEVMAWIESHLPELSQPESSEGVSQCP